jgi:hypothetical protein
MSGNNRNDLQKVFDSFFEYPKTMKEADKDTGVMRESVCRYCAVLRAQKRLFKLRERYCAITGAMAGEYTTNPALKPVESSQLSLL